MIQRIPRRDRRARQARRLLIREVVGDGDEALFVEDGVLAEDAVDDAAEAAGDVGHGGGAGGPGLGEDGHDAVAGLEPRGRLRGLRLRSRSWGEEG